MLEGQAKNGKQIHEKRTTNPRKTDDKSTKNERTHEEQTINVSNTNMFTERKVLFCYKRKEELEEVLHEYIPTALLRKHHGKLQTEMEYKRNGTECKRNGTDRKRNETAT